MMGESVLTCNLNMRPARAWNSATFSRDLKQAAQTLIQPVVAIVGFQLP